MVGRPTSLCRCGKKIIPFRGQATAQHAGTGLDDGWLSTRPFVLYPGAEKLHAKFMFSGGIEMGTLSLSFVDAVGCADDSKVKFRILAYLGGALPAYVEKWWGGESANDNDHFERGSALKLKSQRCRAGQKEGSGLQRAIRAREWSTPG
ncbi:uncharacterized protein ARMOST_08703 [Armillaria ostoyae]|uniref:Uncharacterized protein n=1 Tax=Armillaria ostoyae TaxID=47428 RepID=A0A284R9F6_ARMOS|nr:uncharacterized protein ARMOST_08703 [Armillaria ostoyae]